MIFTIDHPDALILSAIVGAVGVLLAEHLGWPAFKWAVRRAANLLTDLFLHFGLVDPAERIWRGTIR